MILDNIYISGTNGLLGGKFLEKFSQILDLECQVLTRADDYTYQNISLKDNSLIIHAAAETDVELCEIDPLHALKSNYMLTKSILDKCKSVSGVKLYTFRVQEYMEHI